MSIIQSRFKTLSAHASSAWKGHQDYDGLETVIDSLALGAQQVQSKVQAAALADVLGVTGETNVQGEVVQILDTFASDTFVEVLSQSGPCRGGRLGRN